MLLNYTFIPFLLALKVNVPEGTKNFNAEYLFDFNLTAVVYKEFPETTQTTVALICQPFLLRGICCFLQNVITWKTKDNKILNITEVISKEHIKYEKWFVINFNEHGVKDILMHTKSERIKEIIINILDHFNVSGDMITKLLNMPSGLTAKEATPLGICRRTSYSLSKQVSYYVDHETKQDPKFQIVPLAMEEHFAQQRNTSTHIHIEKKRKECDFDSAQVDDFLNRIELDDYNYTMEIVDDKLEMSTAARIRLPAADLCDSTACLVMTKTVLLNLTEIRSPQTITQDEF